MIFKDNFNRTALGSDWNTISGLFTIATNQLNASLGADNIMVYSKRAANNQSVQIKTQSDSNTAGNLSGVIGRHNANAYYYAEIDWNNDTLYLKKYISGAPVTLDSVSYKLNLSTFYTLTLNCNDNNLSVLINDYPVLGAQDTSIVSGTVGVISKNAATTGVNFDDFIYESLHVPTQGFMLPNLLRKTPVDTVFNATSLNSIRHNPMAKSWEEIKSSDPRISDYDIDSYPYLEGAYRTKEIDLNKVYYGAKIKITNSISQVNPPYNLDNLQMNEKGKTYIDISGKCTIKAPRSSYTNAFRSSGTHETPFTHFWCFWIDPANEYVYLAEKTGKIQKRVLEDMSLVAEITCSDVDTSPEYKIMGITGDSTYIYHTMSPSKSTPTPPGVNYVVKRRQTDLGLEKSEKAFNTAMSHPEGIWANSTYIFICDRDGNRVIKCNSTDFSSPTIYDTTTTFPTLAVKPHRIWGDGSYLYIGVKHSNYDSNNPGILKVQITDMTFVSSSAKKFNYPDGIYGDGIGNLVVASSESEGNVHFTTMTSSDLMVTTTTQSLGGYISGNDFQFMFYGFFGHNLLGGFDSGNFYTLFRKDSQIDLFNVNLELTGAKGLKSPPLTNMTSPRAITGDNDFLYVCDYGNDRIIKIRKDTMNPVSSYGGFEDVYFQKPEGICTDNTHLYCIASDGYRYSLFKILNDGMDTAMVDTVENITGVNAVPLAICHYPSDNHLYMISNSHLWKIDTDLNLVNTYVFGTDEVNSPTDCWAFTGLVYITNRNRLSASPLYRVSVFDINGFTMSGSGIGDIDDIPYYGICGTTFGTQGYIYLSGYSYQTAYITRTDYGVIKDSTFGNYGTGEVNNNNELTYPHGIYVDDDDIYIVDAGANRVIKRKAHSYYRAELVTDNSMEDGLPNPQDDYYQGYNIILLDHPNIGDKKTTKRRIQNYNSSSKIIRINPTKSWEIFNRDEDEITWDITDVPYKMSYKSRYVEALRNLYDYPSLKIRTGYDSTAFNEDNWRPYIVSDVYDKIRYLQVKANFKIRDSQTNINVNNLRIRVKLLKKEEEHGLVNVGSTGTKVMFKQRFNDIPDNPSINLNVGEATALYAVITDKTVTDTTNYPPYGGFKIHIYNSAGAEVGGVIEGIKVEGY